MLCFFRRKDWLPTKYSRVCSWHFSQGYDTGPIRFYWNKKKILNFNDPEPAKKKCKDPSSKFSANNPSAESNESLMTLAEVASVCTSSSVASKVQWDNYILKKKIAELQQVLQRHKENYIFSFECIKKKDQAVAMYTGLPTADTFFMILNLISKYKINYSRGWRCTSISGSDQLLLCLMKLRMNCPFLDLGVRFGISSSTASNIFGTYLNLLYDILFIGMWNNQIPPTECLPYFKEFPSCRIIIDCTEFSVARPYSLDLQNLVYSNYKSKATLKGLIAISPNGCIVYASDLFVGSVSDKAIVQNSNMLEQLKPGDVILADKGFTIGDILPQGVTVNIPAFLTNPQFTCEQVGQNKAISSVRIHVERAIQRIKLFQVMQTIPHDFRSLSTKLFRVACCLVNLQKPILPSCVGTLITGESTQ